MYECLCKCFKWVSVWIMFVACTTGMQFMFAPVVVVVVLLVLLLFLLLLFLLFLLFCNNINTHSYSFTTFHTYTHTETLTRQQIKWLYHYQQKIFTIKQPNIVLKTEIGVWISYTQKYYVKLTKKLVELAKTFLWESMQKSL